jgi:prepilin-type N-terminal cleavage/methylation domain-containing protein/prepilin-type processing-associated H-X9-DG protein
MDSQPRHFQGHRFTKRAFTLVELLVVIGIIAVLIGILLPTLAKARESAVAIQCMSNLKQFAIADQMYVNQYNWHMPGWWADDHAYGAYNSYWAGLPEFRKALAMPIIDGEPAPDPNFNPNTFRCYVTSKWFCRSAVRAGLAPSPVDPITHQAYFPLHYSYGMNVQGVDIAENAANADVWDPRATQASPAVPVAKRFHGFKPAQVKRPGEKLHFADAMYMVINVYGTGTNVGGFFGWHQKISNYDTIKENTYNDVNGMNAMRTIAWRHKQGANVVFFDGHGEWMRKNLLYNTDSSGKIIRNDKLWEVMK